jgi:hypothetical protein
MAGADPELPGDAHASRDLGRQPIATTLETLGLAPGDLVGASGEGLTFKQVQRACKGRRLTVRVMGKIERALAAAAGKPVAREELFNYEPLP